MRIRPSAYHGSSSSSLDFFLLLAVETFEKKRLREKYITFFHSRFGFCFLLTQTQNRFLFFGKRASLAKLNSFFFCTGLTELYNGGGGQIERIIHLGKSFDPSEKHNSRKKNLNFFLRKICLYHWK